MRTADTDYSGYDMGGGGGRTSVSIGGAAQQACLALIERLRKAAAQMFGVRVEETEFTPGGVRLTRDHARSFDIAEIAQLCQHTFGPISASGSFNRRGVNGIPGAARGHMIEGLEIPIYVVQNCEIAVDESTGHIEVLAYRSVQDVGRAINPRAILGQAQGALVQGLGYAITEELTLGEDGQVQQPSLESYLVPTALDSVRLELDLYEGAPSPRSPFGSKGAGEIPIVSVAAAVGTAVRRAIGRPVRQIPLTPPRMMRLLHDLEPAPLCHALDRPWGDIELGESHPAQSATATAGHGRQFITTAG